MAAASAAAPASGGEEESLGEFLDEVASIVSVLIGSCPSCTVDVNMRMMQVDMPEFDNKLLCQIQCKACGFASADTVPVETAEYLGPYFRLQLNNESNWKNRVLIKSNSTEYAIPEIGLDSARAGTGDKITVEELLLTTRSELTNAPSFQDTSQAEGMQTLMLLLEQLNQVLDGTMDATLVLSDPKQKMCYIEPKLAADGVSDPYLSANPVA